MQGGARYCGACGTPVASQPATDLEVPAAEFKQATVLFADVVSSTQLVSAMDAEQTMQFLAPVVEAMTRAAVRYEGTIARTLGDGVMAVFGAPYAHEGHALLACQAAIEMHAATSHFTGIQLRIGLHSGEVVFDALAAGGERERQLHGVAIHLASRIVNMAEPGATYLTSHSFALACGRYEAVSVGVRQAKGFDTPVQVYQLLGSKAQVGVVRRSARQAALRGRKRELEALRKALDEVEFGTSQIVGIVGEPGAGKSRLCHEFALGCRGRLIPVLEARAQLYGHATPLQPVLEFLRSAVFRITPSDDASTVRKRIAQYVQEMGETFQQDQALLNEFLGVPEDDAEPSRLSGPARRDRLLEVVGQMVRHLAARTTVILIEDLHWLDAASADFLTTLVGAVAGTPTLLLVNYRPGYTAPWMKSPAFTEIALRDIEEGSMVELVEELIGARTEVHELAVRVAQRSGGNPFFAEELVRVLTAGGTLAGASARFSLGERAPSAALPATVQAVIGARIDQLSDTRKALLQLCAIVGKDFPRPCSST
ncbi:ATP-binding protein [Variovorax ureilyticus]|uniref:ATP-binding protein n=1 Tax=Variovorax ureilyticus TaxID=1836198 RepID=UPI003D670D76